MSRMRITCGWAGLIGGLGIASYFLFIYGPFYQVRVPHTTNPADHALARTVVLYQLMQHEHQALEGVILGLVLALLTVFFCGPYCNIGQNRAGITTAATDASARTSLQRG